MNRADIIAGASDPVVREYLRMADDSRVAILPYALSVVAQLGVADLLWPTGMRAGELAAKLQVRPDALARLIRALASSGFFDVDGGGRVSLTQLGQLLRSDSDVSMRATLSNADSYRAWLRAIDTVIDGRPGFDYAFRAEFFSHKAESGKTGADFDRRMQERAARVYAGLSTVRAWDDAHCILDIGGGTGMVLHSLMRSAPWARGILFDRDPVIEGVRKSSLFAAMGERCRLVAGDFFAGLPSGADIHMLCSVLHNWEDDDACRVLRNSRQALSPGGSVLVCEMLLPENGQPHPAYWSDLGMMILVGGRERTANQYDGLLGKAGFVISRITRLAGSDVHVIEAR